MVKGLSTIITVLVCLVLSTVAGADIRSAVAAKMPQEKGFYTDLTQLLQEHVAEGQVNYNALRKDKPALNRLVQQVGAYSLKSASAAEQKAFYINAYNILVLAQVLEHYPLNSVMDVPGFFDKKKYIVAGEQLTLNELEKERLLQSFKDARVHFALVCAAKSCPPLRNKAYTPDKVEQQLQAQAVDALNHPEFIQISNQKKKVGLSEIFKWYEEDFLAEAPSVVSYINRYRTVPVPKGYRYSFYNYDWRLNDISKL